MDNRTSWKDVGAAIEDELANFTLNLVKRKPKAEKEPSRFNLYVVGIAAFMMLTVLDLIASIITGMLTNVLYGVLVFSIGVGSLAVAEAGFFFPYASRSQKIISVIDGIVSIGSTLLIGVLVGAIYAAGKFNVIAVSGWLSVLEIGMIILLVLIGVTHALLWISYVLIDKGVQMYQSYQQNRAGNKSRNDLLRLSEDNMTQSILMGQRLLTLAKQGKGSLLREEIINMTGEDLLADVDMAAIKNPNGAKPNVATYPTPGRDH